MNVDIFTVNSDQVDPAVVASALQGAGFFVREVNVNEGERVWLHPHTPSNQP